MIKHYTTPKFFKNHQERRSSINQQELNRPISAEAILTSKSGRSLAHENTAITAENVKEFTPEADTIAKVKQLFQKMGFTVEHSGLTLTLSGNKKNFEDIFKVRLITEKTTNKAGMTVHSEGEPVIPDVLKGLVEKVVFPEPPQFFP